MEASLVAVIQTAIAAVPGTVAAFAKGRDHRERIEALETFMGEARKLFKRLSDHTDLDGSSPASSRLSLPIPPATPSSDVTLEGLRHQIAALAARVDKLEGSSERDAREFSGFSNSISRELGEMTGKIELLLKRSR